MNNNLVDDLFNKPSNFKMGILSTYSFNADFFERYLLQLEGIGNCADICVFTDEGVYRSLFDRMVSARPTKINKRYLLVPIKTAGVFHPKLYILASDKLVRIGIGSANLTREGIANNLELVSVFEVSEKDKSYSGLLKDCLDFYLKLAIASKSRSAFDMVSSFANYVDRLISGNSESSVGLLNNLDEALLYQLKKHIIMDSIKKIQVVSPFFDNGLKPYQYLRKICPNAIFEIYVQQGKSDFPKEEMDFPNENLKIYVYMNEERYIHGKALILESDSSVYLMSGSSNFTSAALLSSENNANIEVSLFGKIDAMEAKTILSPGRVRTERMTNSVDLQTIENIPPDKEENCGLICDWLIEVTYADHKIEVTINEKASLFPIHVLLNDDGRQKYAYKQIIELQDIKASDIVFAYIEGVSDTGEKVESTRVWVVNLDHRTQNTIRTKRISDPSQVFNAFRDLLVNGTERELIDYLLSFDIPLNLSFGFIFNPRAIISKGNVFGKLGDQHRLKLMELNVFEATRSFLEQNLNKMLMHYNNLQLDKLDNFMLIYGSTFNMLYAFCEFIWQNNDNRSVIEAGEWANVRKFNDLMLEYVGKIITVVWIPEDSNPSFERLVNNRIANDKMDVLGGIKSLKQYIIYRNYEHIYEQSLATSRNLINYVDTYLTTLKVRTTLGKIIGPPPPLSHNGYSDVYINNRQKLKRMMNILEEDYNSWKTI